MLKFEKSIYYFISFFIFLVTLYTVVIYSDVKIVQYLSVFIIDGIYIYNELFINEDGNEKNIIIRSVVALFLTFLLVIMTSDYIYYVYYFIGIFQIMRRSSMKFSIVLSFSLYSILIVVLVYSNSNSIRMWADILISTSIYIIGYIIISLIDYILRQNKKLVIAKEKILHESLKSDYAYSELKKAYAELEDYTILKERRNIAREMHDNVGHKLTISIVQLEEFALENVREENKEEFNKIINNVRESLRDLRKSVHKLKDNVNWEKEIDTLVFNFKNEKKFKVIYNKDSLEGIEDNKLKTMYRIIQEAITNGIKHGKATSFIIVIKIIKEEIILKIINNGKSASGFKKGFGLNSMTERIKEFNGKLEIESSIDSGFTLTAYIPKGEEVYDKDSFSR